MLKISLRLDYFFEEYSLTDQIKMAKDVNADGVEFGQMSGYDCEKAAATAEQCGIPFVACGFYDTWGTRMGSPFEDIKSNLLKTFECAKTLGAKMLLAHSGDCTSRDETVKASFVENMKPVAELCEKYNIIMALEPHCTCYYNPMHDFSKYFIDTSALGYELIDRIGSPSIKLLFDFYHVQTMEGNLIMNINAHMDQITHFHIAGVPDRNEPWCGELNYLNLVQHITSLGYDRYIGLEYYPSTKDLSTIAEAINYLKKV